MPLRGILDRACARCSFLKQVGTEGMSVPVKQKELALGYSRPVGIGIEQSLSLKQDAGDIEESVGDPANGAAVRVAALT